MTIEPLPMRIHLKLLSPDFGGPACSCASCRLLHVETETLDGRAICYEGCGSCGLPLAEPEIEFLDELMTLEEFELSEGGGPVSNSAPD
jgi:hypothetical protein